MSDQIHRTTLNRICRYGKNGVDFDFDPHLDLLQFKDLYSRKDMKLVSFRVARLYAGKTKQLITPSFVVYIEYTLNYTFILFGMSISCKQ
jgi:hypothetical protein